METYDKDIREWFSGYSSDGTDITIPIASIPELSAAEANTTTGDMANFLYAFMDQIFAIWATMPTAGRPEKMFISKSLSPNVVTGDETVQFSVRFTTAVAAGSRNVVAEA
jgi:hypothetical protein